VNQSHGCSAGYLIFVAPDNNTTAGFPYWRQPTYLQQRSYAYAGGPFIQMTYKNMGWEIGNFNRVMWHETGHIFWACDEYWDAPSLTGCTACTPCRLYGPRAVSNANCANPNASGGCQQHQACIMDRFDPVTYPSPYQIGLCNITRLQIGW